MKNLFILFLCLITYGAIGQDMAYSSFDDIPKIENDEVNRYLYVAVPGIRNYLGYGGHGLLVFDIDNDHEFVKRIPLRGYKKNGDVSNIKGIAVSHKYNSIYVSTLEGLQRIDISSEEIIWEIEYEGGCDRMDITPDGEIIYLPALEKDFWNVVKAESGEVIDKIEVINRSHNTVCSRDGKYAYLGDIQSNWLYKVNTSSNAIEDKVGPFWDGIRPFTIDGKGEKVFVTVNGLLGFQIGDTKTGKVLATKIVEGWDKGPVRRHGNPSHGIGLTPDEKEIWVCDGHNMLLHIFENKSPYQQLTSIPLKDMPGWVTFSIDGKYAYPSSGEIIDVKSRTIVGNLKDEFNNYVGSEKMVEIDLDTNTSEIVEFGNQFGIGRVN